MQSVGKRPYPALIVYNIAQGDDHQPIVYPREDRQSDFLIDQWPNQPGEVHALDLVTFTSDGLEQDQTLQNSGG